MANGEILCGGPAARRVLLQKVTAPLGGALRQFRNLRGNIKKGLPKGRFESMSGSQS
jgi:hypothetical protein